MTNLCQQSMKQANLWFAWDWITVSIVMHDKMQLTISRNLPMHHTNQHSLERSTCPRMTQPNLLRTQCSERWYSQQKLIKVLTSHMIINQIKHNATLKHKHMRLRHRKLQMQSWAVVLDLQSGKASDSKMQSTLKPEITQVQLYACQKASLAFVNTNQTVKSTARNALKNFWFCMLGSASKPTWLGEDKSHALRTQTISWNYEISCWLTHETSALEDKMCVTCPPRICFK